MVALNKFPTDAKEEFEVVKNACSEKGVKIISSDVFTQGGKGGVELAEKVVRLCDQNRRWLLTGLFSGIAD